MSPKHILPAVSLTLALLTSCSGEKFETVPATGTGVYRDLPPESAVPGHIRVKFNGEPAATKAAGAVDLSSIGDCRIVRTFPDGGPFEKRHREAGLHLWYDVFFDESLPLTRAALDLGSIDGVEIVEYVQKIREQSLFPFNDPGFSLQWHYSNQGSGTGAVAGCDINLLPAWEKTTGRRDVIVAINDGGLDVGHEDLAANIWCNEAELNGQPGVDDDGNGYIDDIYGYNFVVGPDGGTPKGTLDVSSHGVHVGGTVAAVNNNGIGVCGVAGGDGSPDSGVRLMSTQTSGGAAYIENAFVYAADNGAVLVNCSWSLDSYLASVSEAIDYFNKYAGIDADGNQTGPMAGGLVLFAAGNDDNIVCYPSLQSNVFAVASVGADYERAYYSNYGGWVDIAAPGGDVQKGFTVYSTLPDNGYGGLEGTSMACPHVTGVAALVVSRFGGKGFTRQNLIDILTSTANPIIYEKNDAKYEGRLGAGLVDAGAAVSVSTDTPPAVSGISASAEGNTISLSWTVPDGESLPHHFNAYYQAAPFGSSRPDALTPYVSTARGDAAAGESVSCVIRGLEFETEYHILLCSSNIVGGESDYTACSISTKGNTKPVISPVSGTTLSLKSHEEGTLDFDICDADGQALSCALSGILSKGEVYSDGKHAILYFNALNFEDGKTYRGSFSVSDGFESASVELTLVIAQNHTPEVTAKPGNIVLNSLEEKSRIDLAEYFSDADGEELSYECSTIPRRDSPVTAELVGSELNLRAASYGNAKVTISAVDARGEKARTEFSVLVRDGSHIADLYPNPVKDILHIRPGSEQTADIRISDKAGAVVLKADGKSLAPFEPLTIDMSSLPGGVYYVSVRSGEGSETYTVAKQ